MNKGQRKYKKRMKKLGQYNRGDRKAQSARYRELYPDKIRAHTAVFCAIKRGALHKPRNCSTCCSTKHIMGHHDDYRKPLEVKWKCPVCHNKVHISLRLRQKRRKRRKK